ncbi:M1 family metallopeptidase [Streptomyces sp. 6N106]|uniref:M1 family metallopeptidase n=1 Tax=Streptomyces sp. 6N106 TaxID=3457418 RepID=UPI003FD411C3
MAAFTVLTLTALTACSDSAVTGRPGAAGVGDPYFPKLGNGGYDVAHYGLKLDYDPKSKQLAGEAVITARATQDLSTFHLDLTGLDVHKVTVEGKSAHFNRAGSELTVRPDDDLPKGETFEVAVRYSGRPESLGEEGWMPTADGVLALGEPTGSMTWFPGNNHPSDKAAYDIEITAPKGLTAISNGELKGTRSGKDGRPTFVWHSAEPMASYLALVAIGKYEVEESKVKLGDSRLPIYTAVDPTQAKQSKEVLAKTEAILKWEVNHLGAYPFASYGAVVDRPDDVGYPLETQTKPVYPGAPDETILVHEMAHHWFGDSVTPKSWRDMWLNEGLATYTEWLWSEHNGGFTAQDIFDQIYKGEGEALEAYEIDPETLWEFPPATPPSADVISDDPVYNRGAMVIHKIRQAVGDNKFYDIIQGWTKKYRHSNADTKDFTAYVEDKAGKNLDSIWGPWLYGNGKPAKP